MFFHIHKWIELTDTYISLFLGKEVENTRSDVRICKKCGLIQAYERWDEGVRPLSNPAKVQVVLTKYKEQIDEFGLREKILSRYHLDCESKIKIVINPHIGGFSLSGSLMNELGLPFDHSYSEGLWTPHYISNKDLGIKDENPDAYRADVRLIKAIEKIGVENASSSPNKPLKIVEIPKGVEWYIVSRHDGSEYVSERHRCWA